MKVKFFPVFTRVCFDLFSIVCIPSQTLLKSVNMLMHVPQTQQSVKALTDS